jgi:hypothetical protein
MPVLNGGATMTDPRAGETIMPQRLSIAELVVALAESMYDEVPDVSEALEAEEL